MWTRRLRGIIGAYVLAVDVQHLRWQLIHCRSSTSLARKYRHGVLNGSQCYQENPPLWYVPDGLFHVHVVTEIDFFPTPVEQGKEFREEYIATLR